MKIEVRFRGLESTDSLREYAVRQVHYHLSRFGHELRAVASADAQSAVDLALLRMARAVGHELVRVRAAGELGRAS